LVYFMIIWYIFFLVLVCCTKKNLATLPRPSFRLKGNSAHPVLRFLARIPKCRTSKCRSVKIVHLTM
jgi:hypothetical protein